MIMFVEVWYCYFTFECRGRWGVSLLGYSSLKSCIASRQLAVVSAYIPNIAFWDTSTLHHEARAFSHSEIPAYCKMLLVVYLCTTKQNNTGLLEVCAERIKEIWQLETFHKTRSMQGLIVKRTSEEVTVAVWFHRSMHIHYSLACCSFSALESKPLVCNDFGQRFSQWKLKHCFHCGQV